MPNFRSLPLLLAITAAAALTGTASAAPKTPASPLPSYDDIDKDKDGIVTLAEIDVYPPAVSARLHRCDTNKDNQLSREEYAQCTHPAAHAAHAAAK